MKIKISDLFDVGVANYIAKRNINTLKGSEAGHAFEHFIFMEIMAYRGLKEKDFTVQYWRSTAGHEVNFILNYGEIAIEIKISETPNLRDLKGLVTFCDDYHPKKAIVVCQAPRKRRIELPAKQFIDIVPWQKFLNDLWSEKYI